MPLRPVRRCLLRPNCGTWSRAFRMPTTRIRAPVCTSSSSCSTYKRPTPTTPNMTPRTVVRLLKLRRHIGTSRSIIHTAVDEAMIATRLLLTNRCANMMTAWSTNSRMTPLTADFNMSFVLNRRSPRSLQTARSMLPATRKRTAPSTNGGKSRRQRPIKK